MHTTTLWFTLTNRAFVTGFESTSIYFWYDSYFGNDMLRAFHEEACVALTVPRRFVPDQTRVCWVTQWSRTTSRTKASDWGSHCWKRLLQQHDWCSLSACRAPERDIPPTNVASAANHPLSSSGYQASIFQLSHLSSMFLCFKSAQDFLIYTNS